MIKEGYHILILLLICLGVFVTNLDVIYVNIMEARNFITAGEMVTDGNWILTTMNGFPRYEKPPLPTWLVAVSGMSFGFKNLWALCLPSAMATLTMILTFNPFAKKLLKVKQLIKYY